MRFLADLIGTLQPTFRIGGVMLSNSANLFIEARNRLNTQYTSFRAKSLALRRVTGANEVSISIGSEPAASINYDLPVVHGATGTVLTEDGTGALSWQPVATAQNMVRADQEVVNFNSVSPLTIFTPPAGVTIRTVTVEVETAFDGVGAQLSVGITGNTALYMGTTDNELNTVAVFELTPYNEQGITPSPVIITFAPGSGATVGSARVTVEYSLPG